MDNLISIGVDYTSSLRTPEVNSKIDYKLPESNDSTDEDNNIDNTLYNGIKESDIEE